MSQPLRLLIVEDSEDDTVLLLRELQHGGYDPIYERVETAEAMKAALARQDWDVVVADFNLPHFNAPAALTLLQKSKQDLPFIIVSGAVGEETAVLAMKAGAHDYLIKGKLARLTPAIEREMREAQGRREHRQTSEALFDRENRFQALIENAADVISLLDADGSITYASPAISRVLGYAPAEAVGLNAFNLLHPDDFQVAAALFEQLLRWPEAIITMQFRFQHRDGSWRWVEAVGSNLLAEPSVQAIVVNFRDIAERKQAEAEIRQRNRELSLLNQVIAASASELEPASILAIACRELALAFQIPQASAILLNEAKTAAEVMAEYRAKGQPSVLGLNFLLSDSDPLQRILKNEGPFLVNEAQHDPRLASFHELLQQSQVVSMLILPLRREGEVLGCLNLETVALRTFSAAEVSLAWSVADQVAGVLTRTRLTQTYQRLSAAIEQAAESIIMTNAAGVIIYVNPAFERISGYNRAEVIGQTPQLLQSGQFDAAFYQKLWTVISAGEVWQGRFVNKKKDGTLYTVEATIAPVFHRESVAIVNYVNIQHDVTHELKLEEQYRQAQKMEAIGRLSGGVAHDFNNLLVVINGYTEMLLTDCDLAGSGPARKYIEAIHLAGERAAGLTRQLLAFSRQQVLQPQVLDLNDVVSNLEKMLGRLISEDIELVVVPGPDLGQVKADPGQIEQVILNLAINARDAMPQGGKLTIETANVELDKMYVHEHVDMAPGAYVMLAVSDSGSGMDVATQLHIFEPFFTTKEEGKGTGLGLATVYGIVKQSDGDIRVYSEPGQGATFKIYLPRIDEAATVFRTRPASSKLLTGLETVLVVEDEESVRALTRQALELTGYTVLEASRGSEALRLYEEQSKPLDLLVTDVVMPGGLNGRELAERLKLLCPGLKVLFMSGYTNEAIIHHGVLEPGLFFLQKPFSPYMLLHKVREILDTP